MALIDDWMPVSHEASVHAIEIGAPVDRVWETLLRTDLTRHPLARLLLGLRAIPALVSSPGRTIARLRAPARKATGLTTSLGDGFALLETRPPTALVIGVTGRFWTPSGGLIPSDPASFRDPVPEGLARAAWGFDLSDLGSGTQLATETRILCGGERARRAFRRYWRLIRPFSGAIRALILREVRREAERSRLGAGFGPRGPREDGN